MSSKDRWDKIDILSKIISSVIIAIFGILITTTLRNKEINNDDLQLLINVSTLLNSEHENQKNIALNIILEKKGVDNALEALYGSINEENIGNLCNALVHYDNGIMKVSKLVESIYLNEVYRVAKIEYRTKNDTYYANGLFTPDGNKIYSIRPLFDSRLLKITINDNYENKMIVIPNERINNLFLDIEREYKEPIEIGSSSVEINDILFCIFIDKKYINHFKICKVVSTTENEIDVTVLDKYEKIPTGAVLITPNRQYIGIKKSVIDNTEIIRFKRVILRSE